MATSTNVQDLRAALRGEVIAPDDAGYDAARAVWNAMIDRRPAAIAACADAADVARAVGFARDNGLLLSVRGGGHNVSGTAVCDGGLMIDLSAMNDVTVDPERRTARVGGGATLAEMDRATQAHGLAAPGGVVGSTGVGGLTLGGGFGWLSRLHGLAVDNLIEVEIVLADGRIVAANETDHADLFWGVRGGGGNFGVATAFTFRLHPVGPDVLFGPTVYRLEDAADVLRHYRAFTATAPRACCVWADLLTAPPFPFLPPEAHGTKVLSLLQCFAGDIEEGERVLAPLSGYGNPLGDAVMARPFVEAQALLDEVYAKGMRNYWASANCHDLSDTVIDALVARAATMPTPQSDMLICQLGGAIGDVADDATAYPHRDVSYALTPGARWADAADDDACVAWTRETGAILRRVAEAGAYVNFIAEGSGRERDAYGANYERLARIKRAYDPSNLFRMNQNVEPA